MQRVYKLAIVGRPNDGKSSIFANFLGDDEVAVSPIPGETKQMQPREINLGECNIEVIDTPGLQHPETVFLKFQEYRAAGRPCVSTFIAEHSDSKYAHDIEIMKALSGADICMLVVNADNFFGHTQKCLLDAFTMLEASVALVGVVNRKDESFANDWKLEFERRGIDCFDFDAFKSKFKDCARLFEEICSSSTFRRRTELSGVLRLLKDNRASLWNANLDAASNEILNSLKDLAQMQTSLRSENFSATKDEIVKLKSELASEIEDFVRKSKFDILKMFKYSGIKLKNSNFAISDEDLIVKEPNIFKKCIGYLPFVKRPLTVCKVNPESSLASRFLRAQASFIFNILSFSYAQSATKSFEMNVSSVSAIPFDEKLLARFFKRAMDSDESDSFYEIHSELRNQLFETLKKM